MMLFSPARRVFATILASSPLYLADRSAAAQITTVVKPLHDRVPDCAFRCIQDFIQSEYTGNACSKQLDINCLCRTNTTNGLTLGEGALRCIFSYCTQRTQSSLNAYSICDSVPGALPKTHATITATVPFANPPAATTQIGDPEPVSYSFTESTSTHPTTLPVSASTTSTNSLSTTTGSSHSTSPTPTTNTHSEPTHTPESTDTLNSSAVIGISVASGISVVFIFGVAVFFCCRRIRHRHRNKEDPNFFEIGGFMSEPPEFTVPPVRRQNPGPQSTTNIDQADRKVMNPFKAVALNPAVVVTKPDHDRSSGYDSLQRIGLAISSESELDTASRSQATPRTLSDLLPDKPDLYPEPLRYSQQSKSSPQSGETFGHSNSWTDSSRPSSRELGSTTYNRMKTIGLPPNPRVMKQCLSDVPPNALASNQRRIPTYANNRVQPIYGAANFSNPTIPFSSFEREDNMTEYGQDSGLNQSLDHNLIPPRFPSPTGSYHVPGSLGRRLEPNDISDSQQSRALRPLTPVREVRTPGNFAQGKANHDYFNMSPPGYPAIHPRSERVSRPRIVRKDDIKRVQIRRGKPQPKELQVPYSPEDYWLEHSRGQRSMYSGRNRIAYNSPSEHSLTPSRRGTDLILRVD